ncbi:MAG: hypothetical protein IJ640_10550 [Prevotella sp.]|nr:hypothetical protein [Prevotella sp.]
MVNKQGDFGKSLKQGKVFCELEDTIAKMRLHMAHPLLTDTKLIGKLYDMFLCKMQKAHPNVLGLNSTIQRSKFIFIALALYSPRTLFFGNKMRMDVRDRLAETTGCAKTLISHNCRNVTFYYNAYRDFRDDVDMLYASIIKDLQDEGLLVVKESNSVANGVTGVNQWAKNVNILINRILDLEM